MDGIGGQNGALSAADVPLLLDQVEVNLGAPDERLCYGAVGFGHLQPAALLVGIGLEVCLHTDVDSPDSRSQLRLQLTDDGQAKAPEVDADALSSSVCDDIDAAGEGAKEHLDRIGSLIGTSFVGWLISMESELPYFDLCAAPGLSLSASDELDGFLFTHNAFFVWDDLPKRTTFSHSWQSSRLGNESFLTYFRFLSSHTTVPAVRHTAV